MKNKRAYKKIPGLITGIVEEDSIKEGYHLCKYMGCKDKADK